MQTNFNRGISVHVYISILGLKASWLVWITGYGNTQSATVFTCV